MKTIEEYEQEITDLNLKIKSLEEELENPINQGPGGNNSMFNWNFNNRLQAIAGLNYGIFGHNSFKSKDGDTYKSLLSEFIAKTIEELSLRVISRSSSNIEKIIFTSTKEMNYEREIQIILGEFSKNE